MAVRAIDPAVRDLARRLSSRHEQLADELVQEISSGIDVYRAGGVVSRASLRRSVLENFHYMLGNLRGEYDLALSAPIRTGRERAEQGAPLPEVLRAFRFGFEFLWRRILEEARASDQTALDHLLETASTIWSLADDYSQALTGAYRDAVNEHLLEEDRRRSALVDGLVTGTLEGTATAWEAARALDLPFEGCFLLVVAESGPGGASGLPGLEVALSDLQARCGWRSQPEYQIVLISLARGDLDAVLAAIRTAAASRVGVSPVFDRLDRAPRAMRFAEVAMQSVKPGQDAVRQFADSALSDLVMANLETTRRVTTRVLGRVLSLPEVERDLLLRTAEAWLEAGGSAVEAGRIAYCHQNTVRYRLRRLGEHMGRTLDDPRAVAELAVALQALRVFPQLGSSEEPAAEGNDG